MEAVHPQLSILLVYLSAAHDEEHVVFGKLGFEAEAYPKDVLVLPATHLFDYDDLSQR